MLQASNVTNKWAHYAVECVRYGHTPTHIEMVKVWTVLDNGNVSNPTSMSRADVVRLIGLGQVFKTITADRAKPGFWNIGALIQVVTIGREKYIKTVADHTAKDNLDHLPPF